MIELKMYEPKFSFGVISDVHIGYYSNGCVEDFRRALYAFQNRGILDVNICGDITVNGNEKQISEFTDIARGFPDITLHICNGNHDAKMSDSMWRQYVGTEKCHTIEYDKFAFVFLSMSEGTSYMDDTPYTERFPWLEIELSRLAGKHIFLFMHFPLLKEGSPDGTAGLKPGQHYGFTQQSSEPEHIMNLLKQVKNVTVFSGHSHFAHSVQSYYPRIIFQHDKNFNISLVHVPSLTVPRDKDMHTIESDHPERQPSAGYVVDVFSNRIKVTGLEFNDEEQLRFGKEKTDFTYVLNPF